MNQTIKAGSSVIYGLDDRPLLPRASLLALQHILTMFGSTVSVPLLFGPVLWPVPAGLSAEVAAELTRLQLVNTGILISSVMLCNRRLAVGCRSSKASHSRSWRHSSELWRHSRTRPRQTGRRSLPAIYRWRRLNQSLLSGSRQALRRCRSSLGQSSWAASSKRSSVSQD